MDENNKFDVVGTNIAEKATMIWSRYAPWPI